MNRAIPIFAILAIMIGVYGVSYSAFGSSLSDYSSTPLQKATPKGGFTNVSCGDHVCLTKENPYFQLQYEQWQEYKKAHSFNGKLSLVFVPQSLDIFAPDGTCNITGLSQTGGSCSVPSMVVSAATYNNMTTNPAIMAVEHINPTQAKPTTSYCDIANWIINAEDGYTSNIVNETQLIDPPYCHNPNPVPVPEFGNLSFIIMALSVLTVISVSVLANRTRK